MKKTIGIIAFILILSSYAIAQNIVHDQAQKEYQAPTTRMDGAVLSPTEIGGFNVYEEGNPTPILTLPPDARSFTVPALGQTIYVTCVDTDGRESPFSEPVVIPLGKAPPSAPGTGGTVTIVIGGVSQ